MLRSAPPRRQAPLWWVLLWWVLLWWVLLLSVLLWWVQLWWVPPLSVRLSAPGTGVALVWWLVPVPRSVLVTRAGAAAGAAVGTTAGCGEDESGVRRCS